jgi:hypothetical protein
MHLPSWSNCLPLFYMSVFLFLHRHLTAWSSCPTLFSFESVQLFWIHCYSRQFSLCLNKSAVFKLRNVFTPWVLSSARPRTWHLFLLTNPDYLCCISILQNRISNFCFFYKTSLLLRFPWWFSSQYKQQCRSRRSFPFTRDLGGNPLRQSK